MIAALFASSLAVLTPQTPVATPVATPAAASAAPLAAATPLVPATPIALGEGGTRLPPGAAPLPVPSDAAVFVNTGSTNTAPYRVVITPAGDVSAIVGGARQHATLAQSAVAKLFTDLAATPPNSLTIRSCMKSASFGSATHVSWHGTTSGDVSCGGDARATALMADARAIETAAGIDPRARGRRFPL